MRIAPKLDGDGNIENMDQFLKDMLADWSELEEETSKDPQ